MDTKTYQYFKDKYDLQERVKEFEKQKTKFPNMIPVILEINKKSKSIQVLQTQKFLVSKFTKLLEFQQTIRKKLNIENENDALFFCINNNKIEKLNKTMHEIYQDSKDKQDGFLYIKYSDVAHFGGV